MRVLVGMLICAAASSAFALTYYLTEQWVKDGHRFCKYGNGTVLNVGVSLCPLSIQG